MINIGYVRTGPFSPDLLFYFKLNKKEKEKAGIEWKEQKSA